MSDPLLTPGRQKGTQLFFRLWGTYTYDANGNRTMSGYDTDADNRLASDGTWDYTTAHKGVRLDYRVFPSAFFGRPRSRNTNQGRRE